MGIPGIAPSAAAALRAPATFAGVAPRALPRETCDVRRVSVDFFVRRLAPVELFFDF